jgi:hypothetical protein
MSNGWHGFNAYKLQLAIEGCCFGLQCLCLQCARCKELGIKTIDGSRFGTWHLKIKTSLDAHCLVLKQEVG